MTVSSRSQRNPNTVGFGIIGPGMIASVHVEALRQVTGAKVVGVAGRSLDRARQFAVKHGLEYATDSVEELVRREGIDVVCIATPSGAHLEPALAAISAGKHLLIEKPLEITAERVERLLTAARSAGVQLAPILPARFGEGARHIKAALEAGRFGRLVLCSAAAKWHRTPQYYSETWKGTLALDGGGAVMNQSIHAIDLLQWLVGLPSRICATITRCVHLNIEAEDTATAMLEFPHGARGVLESSTALFPGWERRLEICGENGSVRLEGDQLTRWEFRIPHPHDAQILAEQSKAQHPQGAKAPTAITTEFHRRQFQDFVDSLTSRKAPLVQAEEAKDAVRLILALYDSARKGGPVDV